MDAIMNKSEEEERYKMRLLTGVAPDNWLQKILTIGRHLFLYVDYGDTYMADVEFEKRGVNVRVIEEWSKVGSNINFIFCSIKNREIPAFLEAIHDYELRAEKFNPDLFEAMNEIIQAGLNDARANARWVEYDGQER